MIRIDRFVRGTPDGLHSAGSANSDTANTLGSNADPFPLTSTSDTATVLTGKSTSDAHGDTGSPNYSDTPTRS